MPQLIGLQEASALAKLRENGLTGNCVYVDSGSEAGVCVDQEYGAGTLLYGTLVTIYIQQLTEAVPTEIPEPTVTPAQPPAEPTVTPAQTTALEPTPSE
jgi:hypothetical protein